MSASAGEHCPSTIACHLLGDGHLDPVGPRQLDQRAGALHALGHHVHAADDLVEGLALAQREAHRPVPALRAGARGHQVTDPGQAAEGEHLPAQGHAEASQLGQAPGDEHGPGVVPEAQAVADAGGDGHDVLGGAGDLAPDDVGAPVDPERARVHQLLHPAARSSSVMATTQAAGCPCATSRARFGPVRTPAGVPGSTSATTSDMRRLVPISIPLARLTTASIPPANGCQSSRTARNPCDGTAMKTMSAPCERLGERRRDRQPVGEPHARQVRRVLARLVHGRREVGRARPQRGRGAWRRRWRRRRSPRSPHRSPPPGRS